MYAYSHDTRLTTDSKKIHHSFFMMGFCLLGSLLQASLHAIY